ncbi:MAG: MerR family transcriptional regulator [Sphingobacteriales bacterium]|nr:MerR family transcriptional regulator [Sphingobacteriales bacterium]
MGSYSIRELERLCNIKEHTLRIWEQRYHFLSPNRTNTNIRYYSDEDLKRVLRVALLINKGYRIGRIAHLTEAQLCLIVNSLENDPQICQEYHINQITTAMIELDEAGFEVIIEKCIAQFGLLDTVERVLYPFLTRIGIMWTTGSIHPAQEHFISNLIRQKIIVAIDALKITPTANTKNYLLFLPEGEQHEIALLVAHYLLKAHNQIVTYLGANVPINDVIAVTQIKNIDYIFGVVTAARSCQQVKNYIYNLVELLPDHQFLFAGCRIKEIEMEKANVAILNTVSDLSSHIANNIPTYSF